MAAERYDPFVPGPFAVGVRTLEVRDRDRGRVFPCEIWYPVAGPPSAGLLTAGPQPGGRAETLAFGWDRVVPLLILTGDRDVPVPLNGVQEIFGRAPEPKRMLVLRRADHQHFADDVEGSHEALRALTLPGEAAWMTAAMLPMSQLCPGERGHAFARGLSLAHLDAVLRGNNAAGRFLDDLAESALTARGVDAVQYRGA